MDNKIPRKTSISAFEVGIQALCLPVISVFSAFVFVKLGICSSMNGLMNRLKKSNGATSPEGNLGLGSRSFT